MMDDRRTHTRNFESGVASSIDRTLECLLTLGLFVYFQTNQQPIISMPVAGEIKESFLRCTFSFSCKRKTVFMRTKIRMNRSNSKQLAKTIPKSLTT